jgi:hypothetical protein
MHARHRRAGREASRLNDSGVTQVPTLGVLDVVQLIARRFRRDDPSLAEVLLTLSTSDKPFEVGQ